MFTQDVSMAIAVLIVNKVQDLSESSVFSSVEPSRYIFDNVGLLVTRSIYDCVVGHHILLEFIYTVELCSTSLACT